MKLMIERNIVISNPETRDFLADSFYIESTEPLPIVFFVHGYKGYKDWGAWDLMALEFAKAGYFFVKFNFSHNGTTLENPLEFADLKAFGQNNFTKELSDYQAVISHFTERKDVNSDRIAIIGHSRGGGITVLHAFEDERVKVLSTMAGVCNFGYRFPTDERLKEWEDNMGALDFAGGTVVHITAGFSALALALVIRARQGFHNGANGTFVEPHSIPFSVLGAGLLWMGWFGFNGGSALGANGLAVTALVNTNTAAAAAALVWMLLSWRDSKPSVLGIITGAVVGLVAITPAAGFVTPLGAMAIGALAAPISFFAIKLRQSRRLDESLDVWACHGMGGVWGALATGLFATKAVNPAGADGLFYGNPGQLAVQALAVAVTIVFAFGVTWLLAQVLKRTIGLSVSDTEEQIGLDIAEHGERAYA